MKYHLIFDLDGTLVDSAKDFHISLSELMTSYGIPPLSFEKVKTYVGSGFHDFVQQFKGKSNHIDKEKIYLELLEIYKKNFLKETKPFPGAVEFIQNTKHDISLCTNKHEIFAYKTLEHFSMLSREWLGFVYGDSFQYPKPHHQGLNYLLNISNTEKKRNILIGDGLPDAIAAKNIGMPFIGVSFGYHPAEELKKWGAIAILKHFDELPKLIEQLQLS